MSTHDRLIVIFFDGIAIGLYLGLFLWFFAQLADARRDRKRRS